MSVPNLQNRVKRIRSNLQGKVQGLLGQSHISAGGGSQLPAVLPFKFTEKWGKGGLLGQYLTPLGEVRGQRRGGILGFGILKGFTQRRLSPQRKMHPGIVDTSTKGHGTPISTKGAVEREKGAYPVSAELSVEM